MLTHQQKLEAVRQACIKANPEIDKENEIAENFLNALEAMPCDVEDAFGEMPNMFHGISLADVMLAIGRREDRIHVTCDGWFCILQTPMHEFARRFQWNLRKDSLDEQGPETIDFLYELLK